MFASCVPDVEALPIRQHREGGTQRPFGADKHDPAVVNTKLVNITHSYITKTNSTLHKINDTLISQYIQIKNKQHL